MEYLSPGNVQATSFKRLTAETRLRAQSRHRLESVLSHLQENDSRGLYYPPIALPDFFFLCVSRCFSFRKQSLNCPFCPFLKREATIEDGMTNSE